MEPPWAVAAAGLRFARSGRDILAGIDWRVEAGSAWAVVGPNGSGKTTLLRMIAGFLFPTAGRLTVLGNEFGRCDLMKIRARTGWVGAALNDYFPPEQPVLEVVLGGRRGAYGLPETPAPGERERVESLLLRVGLRGRSGAAFGVLSQGERQRVLFARALMPRPELLILDEPTSGLDLRAREEWLGTVENVAAGGADPDLPAPTVLLVTHQVEEIGPAFRHALLLADGRVAAQGAAPDVLTGDNLTRAFGLPVRVEYDGARYHARPERSA